MNVRLADTADLPQIMHLWEERRVILNQTDPRFSPPEADARAAQKSRIYDRLHSENAALLVALPTGNVSGFISGLLVDGVGIVDDIALDAHQYYPGMGRALWGGLHDWFSRHAVSAIHVCVPRYSAVEQAFWRAIGTHDLDREQIMELDKIWQLPPELMWMTL